MKKFRITETFEYVDGPYGKLPIPNYIIEEYTFIKIFWIFGHMKWLPYTNEFGENKSFKYKNDAQEYLDKLNKVFNNI